MKVNIEGLCDVRLCQHKRCSQQVLQGLERFIMLCISDKFLLLQKISDGVGNLGEVQNKSMTIASQAEKTANLMHSPWRLPIQYLFFIEVVEDDDVAIAGRPEEPAVEVIEEPSSEFLIP
jgi:hypothetical protein